MTELRTEEPVPGEASEPSPEAGVAMKVADRLLCESVCAGRDVALVRTGTRVDVGDWFRQARLWIAALPGELVLFAGGKRPFVERIPGDRVSSCVYNHVTGELVLPAASPLARQLRLSPLEASRLLKLMMEMNLMEGKESKHA